MLRKCLSVITAFALAVGALFAGAEQGLLPGAAIKASAASSVLYPKPVNNLNASLRHNSYLESTDDGYIRVYYDGEKIGIENYDSSFNITGSRTLEMELDIWGGFYKGKNAYYIVEGRNNTAEEDGAEVIRIIKYDFNWNRKGAAKVLSRSAGFYESIRYPFDYGNVNMVEYGNTLVIVTGHEGYVDPAYNQGHQGFLMVAVDTASMTATMPDGDLWHSFAQYIDYDGSDLYVLEQSEGSRCTILSRYNADTFKCENTLSVLDYGGSRASAWAIACYASVDGIATSSDNVLGIGTSIDQDDYDNVSSDTPHNIYLTVTPKSSFTQEATKVKWLTNFTGDGKAFTNLKLTKINNDRFLVSWGEYAAESELAAKSLNDTLSGETLHYIFIDGNGNKLSSEYTANATISDCPPILNGSKIVFFSSSANMLDFYTIDAATGSFGKKVHRIAGENATWRLDDNGELTISGSNGKVNIDTEAHYVYPLSSTNYWFSYSSSDNAWKPIRDRITSITFAQGITEIGDEQFKYLPNLTEVRIENGVKSIGKEAFARMRQLDKVYIPNSVTSIGEDAFWSGWYSYYDDHIIYATIYCNSGSYAHKYAEEVGAWYVLIDQCKHKYTSEMTKAPTATETGRMTYTCSTCGYWYHETLPKIEPPVNVTDFVVKVATSDSLTLGWTKNTTAEGYIIEKKVGSDWERVVKLSNSATTSYKVTALANAGKTYTFRIKAYKNAYGTAVYSDYTTVSGTTLLGSVEGFKATASTKNSVTLSWTKNSSANGYIIEKKVGSSYERVTKISSNATVKYTITELANAGKTYTFRIKAYRNDNGTAVYSDYVSANGTTVPNAVADLKVRSTTTNSITIGWSKNSGADGYIIEKKVGSNWERVTKLADAETIKYTIPDLANEGKTYTFRIKAYKSVDGTAVYSDYATISGTTKTFAESKVADFRGSSNAAKAITLVWTKHGTADGYIIEKKVGSSWERVDKISSNATVKYTVSGLANSGKEYTFRIRAYRNRNGVVSYTDYSTASAVTK